MKAARLDPGQVYALLAVLAALLLPHAARLPAWLLLVLASLFGWRAYLQHSQRRMPSKWLLLPLTTVLAVAVFFEFRTVLGRTGGVALLALLVGAKLLETRSRRDALLLVYLGYFLVVTNFLFEQSLALGLYLGLMVLLITTLLLSWHALGGWSGQWSRALAQLRLAGSLLLQALPLMALLFVLFPRIDGPLWRLPQDRSSARAGLADSMAPGSFSQMATNDEVAFRASFEGARPEQDLLYWRGPVFDDYDGRRWTQAPPAWRDTPDIEARGPGLSYVLTLEAHQRPWLLALDMPPQAPAAGRFTERFQLVGKRSVDRRLRLELSAVLDYRIGRNESPEVLARALALPPAVNPRARAVAARWQSLPAGERANEALRFFTRQGLQYTLEPPLYGSNAVDDFVFGGKRGFCEHFAGAFVFMLRAAGVPARVVGGYQGGEENGDYLIVRQADAHAWAEVWLAGEGWRRVDPTFAVAPARIREGLASAVDAADLPYLMRLDNKLLRRIQLGLDSVVNGWNQWVIGYTPERQRQLLRRLGIDELLSRRFVFSFVGGLALLLGLSAAWLLWRTRPPQPDPARQQWDRFCQRLAQLGLVLDPAEAPSQLAQRACLALPQRAAQIEAVLAAYLATRYGSDGPLEQLRQQVGAFLRA